MILYCVRYALKKELDSKNNSESMYQLGNLALSIQVSSKTRSQHCLEKRQHTEGGCFQLQQLNCLARQQAKLLMQLRQRRPNCPNFSPPASTLNCPKVSYIDCVDSSVSFQMRFASPSISSLDFCTLFIFSAHIASISHLQSLAYKLPQKH